MLTIRKLAAKHALSRATLLYYDRIGLLRPSSRSRAGYRLYSPKDEARLAEICRYRASGMSVSEIQLLLGAEARRVATALERRLEEINAEMAGLRRQQQVIAKLLAPGTTERRARVMTKEKWVALLDSAGMDEADRDGWHRAFERLSPEAHQDFLESLGIEPAEIRAIRAYSGAAGPELHDSNSSAPVGPRQRAPRRKRNTAP